jgi:hypothetical protein
MKRRRTTFIGAIVAVVSGSIIAAAFRTEDRHGQMNDRLIEAVKQLNEPAVRQCLATGADPNAGDPATRAPLWWRTLAQTTHQHEAAGNGDPALIVAFFASNSMNSLRKQRLNASGNRLEPADLTGVVKDLLESGASANVGIADGCTPISYAQFYRHPECFRMLLAHGANANSAAVNGDTLLAYAVRFSNYDQADELIRSGAGVNAIGKSKSTPLSLALAQHDQWMIALLKKHGAK